MAKPKTCESKIVKGKRAGEVCGKKTSTVEGCDTTKCWGHQSKEVKDSKGFGGSQEGSGRPKLKDPFDVAREAVRQHAELLIRPHFKALGFDIAIVQHKDGAELEITPIEGGGAKVYGESRDGEIVPSKIEDLAAQITAAEKIIDRLWGRPKQAVEHSGGMEVKHTDLAPIQRPEHTDKVQQVLAAARAKASMN